jgi:hypothetical protein
MTSTTDESTSMWLTETDKQLVREYRDETFGSSSIGLRHAVRHAIQQAREVRDE